MIEAEIMICWRRRKRLLARSIIEQEAEAEENKQAIKFSEMDVVSIIGQMGIDEEPRPSRR